MKKSFSKCVAAATAISAVDPSAADRPPRSICSAPGAKNSTRMASVRSAAGMALDWLFLRPLGPLRRSGLVTAHHSQPRTRRSSDA